MRRQHREAGLARQARALRQFTSQFSVLPRLRASCRLAYSPRPHSRMRLMALRQRFSDEMKTAMKAKDAKRLGTIRLMMADVQKQGIAAKNENLSDDEILAVLARMIKQR